MFAGGRDRAFLVLALQAGNEGAGHGRAERFILAVGLGQTAPAGIAANVEHGRKGVAIADRDQLLTNTVRHGADQRRVPGGRLGDGRGERRSFHEQTTRDGLHVDQCRDAEAGLAHDVILRLFEDLRQLRDVLRERHRSHRAQCLGEQGIQIGHAPTVEEGATQLVDLFFQRHAPQEILCALLRRERRILVIEHSIPPDR